MTITLEIGPNLLGLLSILGLLALIGYCLSQWWMTYAILKAGRS